MSIRTCRFSSVGWGLVIAMALWSGGCAQQPQQNRLPEPKGTDQYVVGAMAYQQHDRQRAMAALQASLQENPDLIMARFLLANLYRDKSDYAAAAEHYKRVTELDPYVYSNHFNLGLMYHLLNRLQEAVVSYAQAVKLNPNDLRSNMYLGMAYTALGRPADGLPYAQKATEISPKSAEAWADLGVVLDSLGRFDSAQQAYQQAIELDPERIDAAVNLAGSLVSRRQYAQAINVYQQLLRRKDSSLLRQRYGQVLAMSGQLDAAVTEYQRAIDQNSQNWHALNGMGEVLATQYRAGSGLDDAKRQEAVRIWLKSLQVNPQQPQISKKTQEYSKKLFP